MKIGGVICLAMLLSSCGGSSRDIHEAAARLDVEYAVEWVRNGGDPNIVAANGVPLLHAFCQPYVGDVVIEEFLNHGADPNLTDKVHGTTLLMRVVDDLRLDLCRRLIEMGADVEACDLKGRGVDSYVGFTNGGEVEMAIRRLLKGSTSGKSRRPFPDANQARDSRR